jgi:anthranilate synthase/aminodeoxychorismate synthase-like glutamine amidotransferase
MILMIDNYDSFTYNLVQIAGALGKVIRVVRNDKITITAIEELRPEKIILSPGPGTPEQAGVSVTVAKHFAGIIPILGVCLGHQAIAYAFGGEIIRAPRLMHGKTSFIFHDSKRIYRGLDNPFEATRYHSLLVKRETLPACLQITAWTREGEIMGLRHKGHDIEGVQFHPESFMTHQGELLMKNFVMRK